MMGILLESLSLPRRTRFSRFSGVYESDTPKRVCYPLSSHTVRGPHFVRMKLTSFISPIHLGATKGWPEPQFSEQDGNVELH